MAVIYSWCNGRRFYPGADRLCLCPDRHVFLGLGAASATGRALAGICLDLESCDFTQSGKKQLVLSRQLVLPYLVAGLIGVSLGTYLLQIIQADTLRMILGFLLVL